MTFRVKNAPSESDVNKGIGKVEFDWVTEALAIKGICIIKKIKAIILILFFLIISRPLIQIKIYIIM
ncbi:hypothetical protein UB34_14740 [Photobacterium leiognathi]|nr:hypothetical protein UB34_14740 [Photobacterium leiognathi]